MSGTGTAAVTWRFELDLVFCCLCWNKERGELVQEEVPQKLSLYRCRDEEACQVRREANEVQKRLQDPIPLDPRWNF